MIFTSNGFNSGNSKKVKAKKIKNINFNTLSLDDNSEPKFSTDLFKEKKVEKEKMAKPKPMQLSEKEKLFLLH